MEKGFMAAVEALGLIILEQKSDLAFKDYELQNAKAEIEKLKAKIEAVEKHCENYINT